ncbi:zinc finger protein OZF-like isoform X1 [Palaemon carinicauda]|uniref:zinc finger protein OZF-like isoform X1 n=1 Tax=Palaemon carinicauda TaxID=392227 RepID=UPI0035B64819
MRNFESLEFPIKSEMEDSYSHTAVKLENNELVDIVGLFDDGSLFMDTDMEFKAEPEMEFKAEPEIFESSEADMKYSLDFDASVSEKDLQISKREVNKEEESVKSSLKEECGIQLRSSRRAGKGKGSRKGKECLQKEDIKNSVCAKPIWPESDSKTHTMGGNYEKQFSGVVNLNTHMVVHTGGKFRCRDCGRRFSRQADRKTHYETHNRKKSFKCNVCDKAFFEKGDLTRHYRTHTGEKPFKCSVCDEAFSRKSRLTEHHRIHTGEKPFKCNVCDKAFSERSHFARHTKIHTGEKPFKCNVCDKAFSRKSHLTRHYGTHTRKKVFKCNVCDKAFASKSCLLKHNKIYSIENV